MNIIRIYKMGAMWSVVQPHVCYLYLAQNTLVLLLIACTNFSKFNDDWHNR